MHVLFLEIDGTFYSKQCSARCTFVRMKTDEESNEMIKRIEANKGTNIILKRKSYLSAEYNSNVTLR